MTEKVILEVRGPIVVITNNRPEKRNAFDDEMDVRLFDILAELKERRDVRAVVWRGEGPCGQREGMCRSSAPTPPR